ncbi:hypothetical protein Msi02_37570 [Microbispora siamensis]|uniref:Uncharacterized protein n=1 Tax=Microbispora siamensis TaxID=564413 RepID=A0ABQ4GND1_9ACTN|nr:hypothetical protein Msi02_37570 [Microbispora siamensis]
MPPSPAPYSADRGCPQGRVMLWQGRIDKGTNWPKAKRQAMISSVRSSLASHSGRWIPSRCGSAGTGFSG